MMEKISQGSRDLRKNFKVLDIRITLRLHRVTRKISSILKNKKAKKEL
jgi:hypothetical protein